ncbi:hypothetical protein [Streptococcus sp. FT1-106]|uniref:hypothetical protein n=1 Tax=Streptococcus sp. FT1-106 TaxID=3409994 RepID=UPI003BF51025
MTKELTPTQVEELKQALKDKNNAPHHRKIQKPHDLTRHLYFIILRMKKVVSTLSRRRFPHY